MLHNYGNIVFLKGHLYKKSFRDFETERDSEGMFMYKGVLKTSPDDKGVNVCAWGMTAYCLDNVVDGSLTQIVGVLEISVFDSKCFSCGTNQKKDWIEIKISEFIVEN